jgi:cytochrome c biogenesis protein CcdA
VGPEVGARDLTVVSPVRPRPGALVVVSAVLAGLALGARLAGWGVSSTGAVLVLDLAGILAYFALLLLLVGLAVATVLRLLGTRSFRCPGRRRTASPSAR